MWSKCHSKYGGVTRQLVLFFYGAHFNVFRFVFFSVFSLLSIFFCFICFCCCYFVIFYWTLKKTNWKNHWEWEVNKTEKQCICSAKMNYLWSGKRDDLPLFLVFRLFFSHLIGKVLLLFSAFFFGCFQISCTARVYCLLNKNNI